MDERGTHPLAMMLQMSVIDPIADMHLAHVPRMMKRVLRVLLGPAARLMGSRKYYPEWALHPTPQSTPTVAQEAPAASSFTIRSKRQHG